MSDLNCRNETEIREGYIEEIAALEAQISDESKAELALERGRADAAEKRAAKSEAERDQLRQQVEDLLDAISTHKECSSPTSTPQKFSLDGDLYAAADQARKELEG